MRKPRIDQAWFTLAEACHVLVLSEYEFSKHEASVESKPDPHDARRLLYNGNDIRRLLDSLIYDTGKHSDQHPQRRVVATLGLPEHLEDALSATGLKVMPSADVLDAVSVTPNDMKPILLIADEQVDRYRDMLKFYGRKITTISVSTDDAALDVSRLAWEAVNKRCELLAKTSRKRRF